MLSNKNENQVPAWSWLVRLTHWLVALSVLINFFNESGYWHRLIGYAGLVLIAIRIANGCLASTPSHMRFFWPTKQAIIQHLQALKQSTAASAHPHTLGHNPLGQLAVYVMWGLMMALGFTGWLSRTDAYWGEDWPVDMHLYLSYALMGMVALHLIAIVTVSKKTNQHLVKQMIDGEQHLLNKNNN